MAEPHKQPFQIVVAAFLAFTALNSDLVDRQAFRGDEAGKIISQRLDIGGDVIGALLEGHEDTGLLEPDCALHQECHAEQGFSATRGAA